MAHFAKVVDGLVVDIIVAEQEFIDTLPDANAWVQTSYNTRGGVHYDPITLEPDGLPALRMNYAAVGGAYDAERDAFVEPKPYPSWVLDEATLLWHAPVPRPSEDAQYIWDESTLNWVGEID